MQARRLGEPAGLALSQARVVVLGLGAVGRAVARRLGSFGATMVGVGTRELPGEDGGALADAAPDLAELGLTACLPVAQRLRALDGADALIVCCALTDATRGLVAGPELEAMRPGAFVINVARGPVIDYGALLAALRSGRLGGAGLDVYWDEPIDPADPLLALNVIATPHIGGVTTHSYRLMAERVAAAIERVR